MKANRALFSFWDGGRGHLNRVLNVANLFFQHEYEIGFITSRQHLQYLKTTHPKYRLYVVENRNPKALPPPYPLPVYSHAFRHAQRLCGLRFNDVAFLHSTVSQEIDALRDFRPNVIINDYRDTIRIAAEVSGIPLIGITQTTGNTRGYTLGWWLSVPSDLKLPSCLEPFNEVRDRYGLEPMVDERESFEGNINVIPSCASIDPLLVMRNNDFYVGPLNIETAEVLPGNSDTSQKCVFCYLGESNSRPYWDFDAVLCDVATNLGLKLYVSGSPYRYPRIQSMARFSQNVFFSNHWTKPQFERILTDAVAVLCHGGSTAMLALAYGKPVVFIPWNSEPSSAVFVDQLGAGVHLRHSQEPLSRQLAPDLGEGVEIMGHWTSSLSADTITSALQSIENEDSFQKNAHDLAGELRSQGGSERVLELVESL